jgi:hypothetical protein
VIAALEPFLIDIHEERPRGDQQVMSLALLVDRRRRADLDAAVQALAASLSPELRFDYAGPLAPIDFARPHFQEDGAARESVS